MISTTVSRISKSRGEGILFTLMIEKTYDSAFSILEKSPKQEVRVCHKSVTHPFLFFAFSQIRNL